MRTPLWCVVGGRPRFPRSVAPDHARFLSSLAVHYSIANNDKACGYADNRRDSSYLSGKTPPSLRRKLWIRCVKETEWGTYFPHFVHTPRLRFRVRLGGVPEIEVTLVYQLSVLTPRSSAIKPAASS